MNRNTIMYDNKLVLSRLRELGSFFYRPNPGNLGDHVIAFATRAFFRRHQLPFTEKAAGDAPVNLVYGGGGPFVPYYGTVPWLMRLFFHRRIQRAVILPSSFYGCDELVESFDERFTVFCREEQSYRYLTERNKRAEILLADDMAFTLDARHAVSTIPQTTLTDTTFQRHMSQLRKCLHKTREGRKLLILLRQDAESRHAGQPLLRAYRSFDLSGLYSEETRNEPRSCYLAHLFLHGLDLADIVLTDRLHGGICAALLGKETYLLDNAYGKIAGVYGHSMRHLPHVSFLAAQEECPCLPPPSGKTENARKKTSLLVGICTAQSCRERQEAVRATWMQHRPEGVDCLFFLGGVPPSGEEGDMIGLDVPDDYAHLSHKVLAFFRHALDHYDFDYLFKCDDDTYVHLGRLPELMDAGLDMVGDMSLLYRGAPSGGAGYLLSRRIVEQIVCQENMDLMKPEDVLFGEMARELGATYAHTARLCLRQVPYPMPHNNLISAHWCSPDYMRAIHAFQTEKPVFSCTAEDTEKRDTDIYRFHASGLFRKDSTGRAGRYVCHNGEMLLHWFAFPEEKLIFSQGAYRNSHLNLVPFTCGEEANKSETGINSPV